MSISETVLHLPSEEDTAKLAADIGGILQTGDTLLLSGDIGAGKSAFARALIRSMAGAEIEVPSPTFTLVQTYEVGAGDVWHCDLYRLTHPDEVLELGLDAAFDTGICLIEWPDRLGDLAPPDALHLAFTALPDGHRVRISGTEPWRNRMAHLVA